MKRRSAPSRSTRSEKLALRLTHADKLALHAAAAALRRSVKATQWKAFMAALDGPPRPLPRLHRLLNEPGFFDAGPTR